MYATGHYRNGVLLAPLTAQLVADAMLDNRIDPLLAPVSPSRFGDAVTAEHVRRAWLAQWQREHAAALEALQQAERAYHRTDRRQRVREPDGRADARSSVQKESLDARRKPRASGSTRSARVEPKTSRGDRRVVARRLVAERGDPMKLSHADVEQRMKSLSGWTLQGDEIRKQYTFKDFPEAIAFVNRLAPEAEAADHHPDILINYKRVTLTYSTHSEGGLTDKDFAGAAAADRLASNRSRCG